MKEVHIFQGYYDDKALFYSLEAFSATFPIVIFMNILYMAVVWLKSVRGRPVWWVSCAIIMIVSCRGMMACSGVVVGNSVRARPSRSALAPTIMESFNLFFSFVALCSLLVWLFHQHSKIFAASSTSTSSAPVVPNSAMPPQGTYPPSQPDIVQSHEVPEVLTRAGDKIQTIFYIILQIIPDASWRKIGSVEGFLFLHQYLNSTTDFPQAQYHDLLGDEKLAALAYLKCTSAVSEMTGLMRLFLSGALCTHRSRYALNKLLNTSVDRSRVKFQRNQFG